MKILFAGNKERGAQCLQALVAHGYTIAGVIAHPAPRGAPPGSVAAMALQMGLPLFQPENANDPRILAALKELKPELTVLAGYGQIVGQEFIDLAPLGCINLHGGKLPQYRGSSPMNWALISGEKEFTLSIIRVDRGVDTGDILSERTFPIGIDDTIAQLQETANSAFPDMLLEVVAQVRSGSLEPRQQDESQAAYYPLRFPDDGLILWDIYTAQQIHNRIRALTDPYPGAFTFFGGRRLKLLSSRLSRRTYYGEPGRIYMKNSMGLLVCAADRCLWVRRVLIEDSQIDALTAIERYAKLATLRDLAVGNLLRRESL